MADRLDKPLDEIIKSKERKPRGGGGGGGRGGEKKPRSQQAVKASAPRAAPFVQKPKQVIVQPQVHTMMSRVGGGSIMGRVGASVGGHVIFSNLNQDITEADMRELCAHVGHVTSVVLRRTNEGRSVGKFDVTYAKKADASKAVQKFHGLTLDGRPMVVKVKEEVAVMGGGGQQHVASMGGGGGVNKASLFGAALGRSSGPPVSFAVTLGRAYPQGQQQNQQRERPSSAKRNNSRGSERPARGNGATAGGASGKGKGEKKVTDTKSLDAEMDSYMQPKATEA